MHQSGDYDLRLRESLAVHSRELPYIYRLKPTIGFTYVSPSVDMLLKPIGANELIARLRRFIG